MMAKRSVQPIPWLLFSAGGIAAALFVPVLILLFGLAFPLGWISPPDHDDLHAVLAYPLTLVIIFFVVMLSLFHSAHRFRYTLYDGLQIKHLNAPVAIVCYGGAVVGTAVTAYVLWQLR